MLTPDTTNLAELSQPFFDWCAQGELRAPRCLACETFRFYPTVLCPKCHAPEFEWARLSDEAEVYSYTVVHRPLVPSLREKAPYVVAVVEFPEGIRMMTNIVGCEPDDVSVGMNVTVEFTRSWDERDIPVFRPLEAAR